MHISTNLCIATLTCVLTFSVLSYATNPHRKFEYKLSFKGPHLVQRDGSIPFWEHGGHAIASDESIRITPSLRSKKGHVWSRQAVTTENWEAEIIFRVSGRGRIGADGLALWYTTERGVNGGTVFGAPDQWRGLGIFFDSFDNDNQHNNPYIMAMVNDGTKIYDHQTDGSSQQLGGCLRDFRNKPFPVRAKIEYYQKALTVSFHNGMSNNEDGFELCLRAENVELPPNGFFGVSAATGGLADDHDAMSWITHSLVPPADSPVAGDQVPEEERKKFEKEFDDYWKKLQEAKEDFKREHPDRIPEDMDDSKYFEAQDTRELKQIFEGQTAIHHNVRQIHQKLDEIVGRQERTLSQIGLLGNQVAPPAGAQQGQQQPPQGGMGQVISRHEVDTLMNNQREMVQTIRDLSRSVTDISSKSNSIQNRVNSMGTQPAGPAGGGGGGGGAYDNTQQFNELKSTLSLMHSEVQKISNKPTANVACPPPPAVNCISTFYFVAFGVFQIIIILGFFSYRSSKEAAAKKFY